MKFTRMIASIVGAIAPSARKPAPGVPPILPRFGRVYKATARSHPFARSVPLHASRFHIS